MHDLYIELVFYVIFYVFVQVVDLLVAMCRASLESARKIIIFDPYPSVVDPHDPKSLAFNPKVDHLSDQINKYQF